jgi:hypothetical protein
MSVGITAVKGRREGPGIARSRGRQYEDDDDPSLVTPEGNRVTLPHERLIDDSHKLAKM